MSLDPVPPAPRAPPRRRGCAAGRSPARRPRQVDGARDPLVRLGEQRPETRRRTTGAARRTRGRRCDRKCPRRDRPSTPGVRGLHLHLDALELTAYSALTIGSASTRRSSGSSSVLRGTVPGARRINVLRMMRPWEKPTSSGPRCQVYGRSARGSAPSRRPSAARRRRAPDGARRRSPPRGRRRAGWGSDAGGPSDALGRGG